MENIIIIGVVAFIVGAAGGYVWKARKQGVKCIGCPDAATCSGNCPGCSGNCGCHSENNQVH